MQTPLSAGDAKAVEIRFFEMKGFHTFTTAHS
jgi:hypothetical protein